MRKKTQLSRRRVLSLSAVGTGGILSGCINSSDDSTNGDEAGNNANGDETGNNANGDESDTWNSFRANRYNTGHVSDFSAIEQPEVLWEYETGDDVWGSPVVADGTVYVPSYDRHLHAIDAESGEEIWTFELNHVADATPGVYDDVVVCGSFDHHIYAVDATGGNKLWEYDTGGIVRGSPTIVDGTVYIGSHCQNTDCLRYDYGEEMGELHALDLKTGEKQWDFESDRGILAKPAVSEAELFAATYAGELVALDRETGETHWTYESEASNAVASSPCLVDGTLYFGDIQGTFHAVNSSNGTQQWIDTYEDVRHFSGSPAADDERIYIGANWIDDESVSGVLAFDQAGGMEWQTVIAQFATIGSSPALVDNHLYIGTHDIYKTEEDLIEGEPTDENLEDGRFSALTTEGELVWQNDIEGRGVGSSPAFVDGTVFFGAENGSVFALTSSA